MKTIIKGLIITAFVVLGLFAFMRLIEAGLKKEEVVTCYKLQDQAEQFPDFWITVAQKEMCDFNGIFVDAPVR